jgi:hypothetical protein
MSRGERRMAVWRGVASGAGVVEERWLTHSAYTPLGYRGGGGGAAFLAVWIGQNRATLGWFDLVFSILLQLCAEGGKLYARRRGEFCVWIEGVEGWVGLTGGNGGGCFIRIVDFSGGRRMQ